MVLQEGVARKAKRLAPARRDVVEDMMDRFKGAWVQQVIKFPESSKFEVELHAPGPCVAEYQNHDRRIVSTRECHWFHSFPSHGIDTIAAEIVITDVHIFSLLPHQTSFESVRSSLPCRFQHCLNASI